MPEPSKFVQFPNWRNWGRNFQCRPARLYRPGSVEEIVAVIRHAHEQGWRVRPVGAGYSYTRLVQTDEVMVSLDRWTGIESVDPAAGTAVIRGGTELHALIRALAGRGLALENIGDIDRQTLAGAIATNTHGTGIRLGAMSTQIAALELATADGTILEISSADSDLFRAAAVSLGALGIITRVTMRVQPMYWLSVERKRVSFDEVVTNLEQSINKSRNYEFFWFPRSSLVYSKAMNPAPAKSGGGRTLGRVVNDLINENAVLWAVCEACRHWPNSRDALLEFGGRFVPQDSSVQRADSAYATERLVRHQEMEYAVPAARTGETLRALDAALRRFPTRTIFPIEVRFTRADNFLLSPASKRDVAYIAVHTYWKEDHHEYFDACEDIFLKAGGRPHWGKLHNVDGSTLRNLYEGWDAFESVRHRLDPGGLFLNSYLRRVLRLSPQ